MKNVILNFVGYIILLIGILILLLEEPIYAIGFLLLASILISPISNWWRKKNEKSKMGRIIPFSMISLAILIGSLSFGRKAYYDSEPTDKSSIEKLSIHPISFVELNNGIEYGYIEKGDGPTVILLHGFPDLAGTWDETISELSKSHRVIAPFLRGYYPTSMATDGDYFVKSVAEDIVQLTKALDIDSFVVVGQDWGASVAYSIGNLAENRVKKL